MKRIYCLSLVSLLLFAACASSPKPAASSQPAAAPKPSADSSLTEGQRIEKSKGLADAARHDIDKNKNADGLDKANAAIALDPENGEALLQQGRAYKNLGKATKAIASFEASMKYYNYLPSLLVNLSLCYRDMGNISKARESLEKALELQPNDSWANREMGWTMFFKYNDATTGLRYWSVAVEQGATDPWIYNDMAAAYDNLGNTEKFRECVMKAKTAIDSGQGDDYIKKQTADKLAKLK
jgi:tetratricopeptide (TPR) repeat protein